MELSDAVLGAVDEMGFAEPTPVQRRAIPAVLAGRDVMAAAQTGTGKTAAFVLPLLDRMPRSTAESELVMLVITPTRELAMQIEDVCAVVGRHTGHTTCVVVGGVGVEPQKQALKDGCDILVATPGRLLDLMEQGACNLLHVQALVIDEADRLLDMGFLPDVKRIVRGLPHDRQTLLFSATLSDDVLAHTSSLVKDPMRVDIAPSGTAAETIDQYVLDVEAQAKKRVLVDVLRHEGSRRVIVFVRGKHRADHLSRILCKKGFSSAPIHGDRTQRQRVRALRMFDEGAVDVLVATDVLSRGIDIEGVAYVVNVDVPHEPENYIHRIGRTGRAGQAGWALTLCSPEERRDLQRIERLMGKVIPPYPRIAELSSVVA